MKRRHLVGAAGAGLLLVGCAQTRHSTPPSAELLRAGIRLERSLPAVLPGGAQVLPQELLVLLPGESAAGMLMPVPFVAGAIGAAMDRNEAAREAQQLASIHPFALAQQAWQGSPLASHSPDALVLQPFAFLQACVDDHYRVALVHQLSRGEWTGRYIVHLPTSYDSTSFHRVTPALLQTLETEMRDGTAMLLQLVERGARGELRVGTGRTVRRVDIGSLHLVGNRAAGLVSPNLVLARGAKLIEESETHVVVRMDGDPAQPASAGGLFFGVHWLRKAQLHTFRPSQRGS